MTRTPTPAVSTTTKPAEPTPAATTATPFAEVAAEIVEAKPLRAMPPAEEDLVAIAHRVLDKQHLPEGALGDTAAVRTGQP